MPILWPLNHLAKFTNQRSSSKGVGPFQDFRPLPTAPAIRISGVTRDSSGAALGNVSLELFRADTGTLVERLTSDGSGNYASSPVGPGILYQIDAYKSGSPDVAGTTVNTLAGA